MGNFRGSMGNFRGSLGNFRGTSGLLLSSTVRELPGKSPKTSGEVRGTSGEVRGLLRSSGEPDSLPATRQICLQNSGGLSLKNGPSETPHNLEDPNLLKLRSLDSSCSFFLSDNTIVFGNNELKCSKCYDCKARIAFNTSKCCSR